MNYYTPIQLSMNIKSIQIGAQNPCILYDVQYLGNFYSNFEENVF